MGGRAGAASRPGKLKEVVPERVNPEATLEAVIRGLKKYTSSPQLTVAVQLNRQVRFTPSLLKIPSLNVASLWLFAATTPDQSKWNLWEDFLEEQSVTPFAHPEA